MHFPMVTLHRGPSWKISVYAAEHGVPHFHIEGPEFRASVSIATLEVIVGQVPRRVLVAEEDADAARRLLQAAGLGHELRP